MEILEILITGNGYLDVIKVGEKFCVRRFSIHTLFTKFTPYEYANIKNKHDEINNTEDCIEYKPNWQIKKNLTEDYFGCKDDATMVKLSILIKQLEYLSGKSNYEKVNEHEWYYEI